MGACHGSVGRLLTCMWPMCGSDVSDLQMATPGVIGLYTSAPCRRATDDMVVYPGDVHTGDSGGVPTLNPPGGCGCFGPSSAAAHRTSASGAGRRGGAGKPRTLSRYYLREDLIPPNMSPALKRLAEQVGWGQGVPVWCSGSCVVPCFGCTTALAMVSHPAALSLALSLWAGSRQLQHNDGSLLMRPALPLCPPQCLNQDPRRRPSARELSRALGEMVARGRVD